MWERTLQDLIRGLRANRKDESRFIAKAVDEIRQEIKSDDMELKAGAVLKLTYLDMLGYDMNWASFHVVEVMSSSKFHLKSVGYLAAAQSFNVDTDVLMLTTNLLKKDLSSNPADTAVTLNGLSSFMTSDLARDLTPELIAMLNHSRAHIRKRAVLAMYKVLDKHPESSPLAKQRLIEKLDDPDPGVVAATVNVLCESARRNPQDYLSLAPQLFHLLTTSTNNWMLIKIIKLFGSLSPHEPRLVKKLQPPITELISTTPAISLLYECVHTCIIGGMLQGPSGDSLAKLCVSKLAAFIQDTDQNLKYIALLAMTKIVPSHPHLLAEYQDTILSSVNDQDISIRMRALDLMSAMVNRSNLQSIVQQLLSHLLPEQTSSLPTATQYLMRMASSGSPSHSPSYRLILSQRILSMCSQSTYENITNFQWYLSVLVDLAHIADVDIGAEIRDQLVDIVGRVRGARSYAVKLMHSLLTDESMITNTGKVGSCSEVLWAAAWICGEYCDELSEPEKLLPYLLRPAVNRLPPDILAVYVQASIKIFGYWASDLAGRWDNEDLPMVKSAIESILERMKTLVHSPYLEVQERATNILQLCNFIIADLNAHQPNSSIPLATCSTALDDIDPLQINYPKSLYLVQPLFSIYELNPVAANAQASVPIPDGLDLDSWIVSPPPEPVPIQAQSTEKKKGKERNMNGKKSKTTTKKKPVREIIQEGDILTPVETAVETPEERERRKAERREQLKDDPYYIIDDVPPKPTDQEIESIPIIRLQDLPSISDTDSHRPILRAIAQDFSASEPFVVDREGEMPQIPSTQSPPSQAEDTLKHPTSLSLFPSSEKTGDVRTSTPEPIKVVRTKKKAGTSSKEGKKGSVKKSTPAVTRV